MFSLLFTCSFQGIFSILQEPLQPGNAFLFQPVLLVLQLMQIGIPCPLGDVSHIIHSHPGEGVFIEDDEILPIICVLEKPRGATIFQQLTANHSLVGVKP